MTLNPPQQPASAVIGRVLISLGVLSLGAVAFRLSLRPVSAAPATQNAVQQDALQGARRVQVSLEADVADLSVSAADLPGEALRGQLSWPAQVTRQASRSGDRLALAYSERLGGPSAPSGDAPSGGLRLDGDGLHWGGLGSPPRRWNVQIGRAVPTQLDLQLAAGDLQLRLAGARLSALRAQADAGDLNATLPAGAGDVWLQVGTGDLTARFVGAADGAGGAHFVSRTGPGDVRLDLGPTTFGSVEIEAGSGDVDATLPDRPEVTASVQGTGGDVDLSLGSRATGGHLSVSGVGGDLTLRLPAGLPVRLKVQGVGGDVDTPDGWTSAAGTYQSPGSGDGQSALHVSVQGLRGDLNVQEVGQ